MKQTQKNIMAKETIDIATGKITGIKYRIDHGNKQFGIARLEFGGAWYYPTIKEIFSELEETDKFSEIPSFYPYGLQQQTTFQKERHWIPQDSEGSVPRAFLEMMISDSLKNDVRAIYIAAMDSKMRKLLKEYMFKPRWAGSRSFCKLL